MATAKAAAAKAQAEVVEITNGKFKHKLSHPVKIEENEYTELEFDFEGLTGLDMIAAAKDRERMSPATASGDGTTMIKEAILPDSDRTYQAFVAAKAAKVHPSVILGLPARDFSKITRAVAIFLLGSAF